MKTFDFEAFKAGQKAYLIEGKCFRYGFTTSEGRICVEYEAALPLCDKVQVYHLETLKKAHMVSRHQHLIDSYDQEDTWVAMKDDSCTTLSHPFEWFEHYEYRLHKHNDLIKAWKKGAKIEIMEKDGTWVDIESPYWYEDSQYRIKPEPEFTYPIYKKHIDGTGLIVKFLSMTEGEIVENGKTGYIVGQLHNDWWVHTDASVWQDWMPLTEAPKEPTIHCLAYNAKRFDHEQTRAVRARVVKKEVAQANGWTIIKEWEV